eukprot:scaffold1.g5458.t1
MGEHQHHHGLKKALEAGAVGLAGYELYEHHERKEERKREEELGRERLEAGPPVVVREEERFVPAPEQGYGRPEGGYYPPQAGAASRQTWGRAQHRGGAAERYQGGPPPQPGYYQQGGYEGYPPYEGRREGW